MTLEKFTEYLRAIGTIEDKEIQKELSDIVTEIYEDHKRKPRRKNNTSPVCQLDDETLEVVAKYETLKEAKEAIAKELGISGSLSSIGDAVVGRTSTHRAYGYRWVRENELEEILPTL